LIEEWLTSEMWAMRGGLGLGDDGVDGWTEVMLRGRGKGEERKGLCEFYVLKIVCIVAAVNDLDLDCNSLKIRIFGK
jgi:hypothetical protein